ncbi:hypothetical protein [Polymorphum gilvum]|uniref:hypothetical protein n=1 Tax=Polymorphum gilvum TaxID=991904 RepID=UPI001F5AF112|nr:hypothetical protein [Polymorphum gilvum]
MRTFTRFIAFAIAVASVAGASSGALAGGKPLSCYRQVVVPAEYRTVHETVLVRPASSRVVEHPPVYRTVTERVVLQPERISYRKIAPIYDTRARQVLVRPASVGWEYRTIKGEQVLCKVQHPPLYRTVHEQVLLKPGGQVAVTVPAIYGTRQRQVLMQPGRRQVVTIPAEYRTVARTVKVSEARTVWQPVALGGQCR